VAGRRRSALGALLIVWQAFSYTLSGLVLAFGQKLHQPPPHMRAPQGRPDRRAGLTAEPVAPGDQKGRLLDSARVRETLHDRSHPCSQLGSQVLRWQPKGAHGLAFYRSRPGCQRFSYLFEVTCLTNQGLTELQIHGHRPRPWVASATRPTAST